MVLIENLKFPLLDFFRPNWSKKVFGDILRWNLTFLDYKIIDIRLQNLYFPKGVSPWFSSKIWNVFILTFLGQIDQKNNGLHFERKIKYLHCKIIDVRNLEISENLHFPKGDSPWFWSKISNLFTLTFLGKIDKKMIVDILIEK